MDPTDCVIKGFYYTIFMLPKINSAKQGLWKWIIFQICSTHLHGITVHDAHVPHDNAARTLLTLLNLELAALEGELQWIDRDK